MKNTINFEGQNIYPSKIVCVGRNYVSHIKELNNEIPAEPVIFIKPNSSIVNDIPWNLSISSSNALASLIVA